MSSRHETLAIWADSENRELKKKVADLTKALADRKFVERMDHQFYQGLKGQFTRAFREQEDILRAAAEALRDAEAVIDRGVDIMTLEQVSTWEGVRSCQETIGTTLERIRKCKR